MKVSPKGLQALASVPEEPLPDLRRPLGIAKVEKAAAKVMPRKAAADRAAKIVPPAGVIASGQAVGVWPGQPVVDLSSLKMPKNKRR